MALLHQDIQPITGDIHSTVVVNTNPDQFRHVELLFHFSIDNNQSSPNKSSHYISRALSGPPTRYITLNGSEETLDSADTPIEPGPEYSSHLSSHKKVSNRGQSTGRGRTLKS